MNFPDVQSNFSTSDLENFWNKPGYHGFGNNGSVFDYFHDVSFGRLQYTNIVFPYYAALHARDYYTDERVEYPRRAQELVTEAVVNALKRGHDLSALSAEANCSGVQLVVAVNVLHAGPYVNEPNEGLWAHQFNLPEPIPIGADRFVFEYQISDMAGSEDDYQRNGESLKLATFCHESGHMVADFPDLSDPDTDEASETDRPSRGVGAYCLMGHGAYVDPANPVPPCGYLRLEAGWAETIQEVTADGDFLLRPDGRDLLVVRKDDNEYFVIEYRRQAGRDAALPAQGVAVWHVDKNMDGNSYEQRTTELHYECALLQADGLFELEKDILDGDSGDLFLIGRVTRIDDQTIPNTRWWDGTGSGLKVLVKASGPKVTKISLRRSR